MDTAIMGAVLGITYLVGFLVSTPTLHRPVDRPAAICSEGDRLPVMWLGRPITLWCSRGRWVA